MPRWGQQGLGAEAAHLLPSTQEEVKECAGWGKSSRNPERPSSWFPSLRLSEADLGVSLRPPETHGVGGGLPIILKVDVPVLLKAILKQPFLSPAALRSQAIEPSA